MEHDSSHNIEWRTQVAFAVRLLGEQAYFHKHLLARQAVYLLWILVGTSFTTTHTWYWYIAGPALVLYLTSYYIYTHIALTYIRRQQLVEALLDSPQRFCALALGADAPPGKLCQEEILTALKAVCERATAEISRTGWLGGWRRVHKVLFWIAVSGALAGLLVLLLDYLDTRFGLHLPAAISSAAGEVVLVFFMALFVVLLENFSDVFKTALFGQLQAQLTSVVLPDGSPRTSGSLRQRFDLAHHNQHIAFFLVFWLYGLAPVAFCVFYWAIGLADNPWLALPALAAFAAALGLAALELFGWRQALRLALAESAIAVGLIESELALAGATLQKKTLWRKLVHLFEAPADAAVKTAQQVARRLTAHLPTAVRQPASRRVAMIAWTYVGSQALCAALLWRVVGAGPGGIAVLAFAFALGGLHLAVLLRLARESLPVVEILEYMKQNL